MAAVILDEIPAMDPEAFSAAVAAVECYFVDEGLRDSGHAVE